MPTRRAFQIGEIKKELIAYKFRFKGELRYFRRDKTKNGMLVEFRVSNFRSVADEQVLSFVPATNQQEYLSNIIIKEKYKALNVLAIYGPNNSGKSSLLQSFHLFASMILTSARNNSTNKLNFDPNLLIESYADKPTQFQVMFILKGVRYRYGFSFSENQILSEWLYRKKTGREVYLFLREKDVIDVSSGLGGGKKILDAAIEATRDNALFLSTGDVFNIAELSALYQWIGSFVILDGLDTTMQGQATEEFSEEFPELVEEISKYISKIDLGISRLVLSQTQEDGKKRILSTHPILREDGSSTGKEIAWALSERESSGTQKIFQVLGPIITSLKLGSTTVIDEIEAKLHTKLTMAIVNLFLDPVTNPNQAQLIFATHDTNLLNAVKIRRDQINFVEKDNRGATQVYSLSDFRYFKGNKERPDTDKEKRYLEGRYGAVPNVSLNELIIAG